MDESTFSKTRAACRLRTLVVCLGFVKKTRFEENIVLRPQIIVSSGFLLFKLLRLTSSCAPVIITTTTRGRCPATNISTGRNKMFTEPKGRFSDEDGLSVFLFALLCYKNCWKYQLKSKEEEEEEESLLLLCSRHLNGWSSCHLGTRLKKKTTTGTTLFFNVFFFILLTLYTRWQNTCQVFDPLLIFSCSVCLYKKKKKKKKKRHHQDLELVKSLKNINHDILKTRKWVAVGRRWALTVPPVWAERGGR